jgi:hypothetical protein
MLMWSSFVLFNLLLFVGIADALYLHLWRFRLFAQPESRVEHALHTVRALLVPMTAWLLFVAPRPALWAVIAVIGLDQVAMVLDVWVEPRSRRNLGGLPSNEYLIHIVAVSIHVAALALAFVGRFGAAAEPFDARLASWALGGVINTAVVALLHVALLHPYFTQIQWRARASTLR